MKRVTEQLGPRPHFRGAIFSLCVLLALANGFVAAQSAPSNAPPTAVPAYRQADHVAVLTIEGEIDTITLRSLERRMAEAKNAGATAVVIELDTPGGDAYASLDICNLLKDRSETPANIVAWVRPNAYSAGAIIALACREIIVSPIATMGDAAPIGIDPITKMLIELPPAERAKIEAPLLTEVIDSARRNHYDENLVQAFISLEIELWLIEHLTTGERVFATREEYVRVFGEQPPQEFVRVGSLKGGVKPFNAGPRAATDRATAPVDEADAASSHEQSSTTSDPGQPQQGGNGATARSLDPTPEQIKADIEKAQQLPSLRVLLSDADRGQWTLIGQVDASDRLLTIKSSEIMHYGLGAAVIADDTELLAYFGAKQLTRLDESWSEGLVRFLVSPWIRGLLLLVLVVCGFIELQTPGVGAFGITAAGALLLLLGAPALAGLASWWEIVLIGAGIVLIMVELFLLPGFGVAGVAGIACLLVGIIGTFVSNDLQTPGAQEELWTGMTVTLTALFLAGVVLWFVAKQFESLPLLNRFVLKSEGAPSGTVSGGLLAAMHAPGGALKLGDTGIAETDLRPSGRASFGGRLVDVSAVGTYISRGAPVRVVSVGRMVIEVEEHTA